MDIIIKNKVPEEIEAIKKHLAPSLAEEYTLAQLMRKDYEQRDETYKSFTRTTGMSTGGCMRHRMQIPPRLYWAMVKRYGTEYWSERRNWSNHPECMVTDDRRSL